MEKNKKKKIVVFGATGKTGQQIVRYALEKGHHVTAFVRDKSKLNLKYHNLNLLKGDVRNPADVSKAVKEKDIVISSLGVRYGKEQICCEGTVNIIGEMQKHKLKKLIAVSAYGTRETSSGWYGRILNFVLRKDMQDKSRMEEVIEKSKMDWMVVRPVLLTNAPATERYNVTTGEIPGGLHFISREDTAHFIVDSLDKTDYKKKFVTIYG